MRYSRTKKLREVPIMFYVSEEEKQAIVSAAEMRDMSISEFCRKTLLNVKACCSCKGEDSDV